MLTAARCTHPPGATCPLCPLRAPGVVLEPTPPNYAHRAPPGKFLYDSLDPLPAELYRVHPGAWAADPWVRDRHKAALLAVCGRSFAYPGGAGRGVVTAGGGRYWHMSVMLCRMLREVGCELPIEFWYRGACERVDLPKLHALNVTCIDADAVADRVGDQRLPKGRASPGGWEAKCYALSHTAFDEVVWLDSDIVPHADPAILFDELDRAPVCYWHEGQQSQNIRWPGLGFDRPPPGLPLAFQSGQFVIDRRRCWPVLAVGQWMAQHSDFFFRHMHGDQDAYRVAMGLLGVKPGYLGECRFTPNYGGVYYHRGRPLLDHYFQAKLAHEWLDPPAGRARALAHFAALVAEGA